MVASFFIVLCPPTAPAGVEPTPFKVYLTQTIQQIIVRLYKMDPTGAGGATGAGLIITRLEAIADPARNVTNVALAKNVLGVMDRITRVSFDPQPEPPGLVAVLNQLITLGFETPPEKLSLATESSRLMDRITARLFDPQPEPPGVVTSGSNILYIVSGISKLTLDATTQERNRAKTFIGILSQVEEVLFDPQPEPPGKFIVPMFDILNQMSILYINLTGSDVTGR
ncbi:MAG: hypothetical protein QME78_05600 [Thermodesulfobacteriota bacterium]|nr:hypothetical protein [Thermodesulfobacteriota bacterium]